MSTFVLQLMDSTHSEQITAVTSFIGEDASGSFGLQAQHAHFITALVFGLAKFCCVKGEWQYLAVPGGILVFKDNMLTISTRHFLLDTDFERISALLQQQLLAEEEKLRTTKSSLQTLEQAMLKRMLALQRKPGWSL